MNPGQCAYEAFAAVLCRAQWSFPAFADHEPKPVYQEAWEAAAEAVLALKEEEKTP